MSIVKISGQPAGFKPITLSITLTSHDEVEALKHLTWRNYADTIEHLNKSDTYCTELSVLTKLLFPIHEALKGG